MTSYRSLLALTWLLLYAAMGCTVAQGRESTDKHAHIHLEQSTVGLQKTLVDFDDTNFVLNATRRHLTITSKKPFNQVTIMNSETKKYFVCNKELLISAFHNNPEPRILKTPLARIDTIYKMVPAIEIKARADGREIETPAALFRSPTQAPRHEVNYDYVVLPKVGAKPIYQLVTYINDIPCDCGSPLLFGVFCDRGPAFAVISTEHVSFSADPVRVPVAERYTKAASAQDCVWSQAADLFEVAK